MADIISVLREEVSQSLLENGVSGVGALQTREFGYTEEKLEFSFKNNSGSFRHAPTREKLFLAAAAATSGAKLIGYFPASGLSSVTVQDALDELRTQVAAGGGGTVVGTGTVGNIPKRSGALALADSILSEASSKLLFSGDTTANIYLAGSGILKTDGNFQVAGQLTALSDLIGSGPSYLTKKVVMGQNFPYDNSAADDTGAALVNPTLTKNNGSTRKFWGMTLYPTFNAGGSNAATIFNILEIDSQNTALTGLTVNLAKWSFGGSQRFRFASNGDFSSSPDGATIGFSIDSSGSLLKESNGWNINAYTSAGSTGWVQTLHQKALGSIASPSDVGTSQIIHTEFSSAYSGGSYREGAKRQTVVDGAFTSGQNPPQRMEFYTAKANSADTLRLAIMSNGNLGFHTTSAFGDGERVIGIQDCTTLPSTTPSGGGVLVSDGGALKWKGSSGTLTTIAPA